MTEEMLARRFEASRGRLHAIATRTADGKTIFVKAVNTNRASAVVTSVTIEGAVPAARAELKTVTAPSFSASNDFSRPDAVSMQTRTIPSARSFVVTLPKHSVSVIVLRTR